MIRNIFAAGKWILGGVMCLLIVVVVCELWYKHSIAPYEKEAAETARIASEWEKLQKANTNNVTEEVTTTPAKSTPATAEKPITETIDVPGNVSGNANTSNIETGASPAETAEDVPVSPHGFGPYPKLPDDPWWSPNTWKGASADHELILRVLVKLWNQGTHAKGGVMRPSGLVYPIIAGVRYVEWDTKVRPSGESVRYISRSTGHPDDGKRLRAIRKNKSSNLSIHPSERNLLTEDDIPPDIKLVSYQEGGINPYAFLDLP